MPDVASSKVVDRATLVKEVGSLIIESVHLNHIQPQDVTEATSLFEEGLGLDSVDILEIVVAMEQKYGVKVPDAQAGKEIFQSVGSIVDYISTHQ